MKELYQIYANIKCRGDLRIVRAGETQRLALILGAYDSLCTTFAILLCAKPVDEDMATASDFIFTPVETGIGYKVMVEADLVGTVYRWQLGEKLGGITPDMVSEIIYDWNVPFSDGWIERAEEWEPTRHPAGLPARGPRDPRWKWKLDELDELNNLVAPFWREYWRKEALADDMADFD